MEFVAKLSPVAISNILLATDFSFESQTALQYAISLAKRCHSRLFIAHAVSPEVGTVAAETPVMLHHVVQNDAEQNMAQLEHAEELRSAPHEMIIEPGAAWHVINDLACRKNIDLIVMGTHGRKGIPKLFLGSTAEKVIRYASCPVLTVGPEVTLRLGRFEHILYATDFCDGSVRALTYALSLAQEDRAELTMLHVVESKPDSAAYTIEWKREGRQALFQLIPPDLDLAWEPEIEVEAGDPAEEIVRMAEAKKADLIAMGSRAGNLSTHFGGTTLHQVLQKAHCPVLTVRGSGGAPQRVNDGGIV